MKKLAVNAVASLLLLGSSHTIYASTSGGYAGIGLGVSNMGNFKDANAIDQGGFAGRVLAGYRINDFLSVEASYAKLNNQRYGLNENPWITANYKLSALSVVGKLYLPINESAKVNIGFGAAEMFAKLDATSVYNPTNHYVDSINPLVATINFGAEVAITEHWKTTLDLIAYGNKRGEESHMSLPESGLLMLGLIYQI